MAYIEIADTTGAVRQYEIVNQAFAKDMLENADSPESTLIWLGLGEAAGYLRRPEACKQ